MSFMEVRSAISICNKALSRIRQQPLQGSLDDPANLNKHAARECNTWYKTIVRQVLSQHHWGLASKQVGLVQAGTNPRLGQWSFAYLPPEDMAFPIRIGPPYGVDTGAAAISYYHGLGAVLASVYGKPLFLFENGIMYSWVEGAVLDYVSFDLTEQDFNEAVEGLIVLYLAEQLAYSVAKDDKLARELHAEGVARQNLEIAQNLNMQQPRYDMKVSDSELARMGYRPSVSGVPIGTGAVPYGDDPGDLAGLI